MQLPEFEGTYDRSHYVFNYQSNHDIYFVYGSVWKVLKTSFSIGKHSFIKQKLFTKSVCFFQVILFKLSEDDLFHNDLLSRE